MSDRDQFGLRGPVKGCELHRTWFSRGCGPDACETEERSDMTIVEFRLDGSLERRWYKNPPPHLSEWTTTYVYNDRNQLSIERTEQGGTITNIRAFEYDSVGRLCRVVIHNNEGEPRVAETYSYEAGGRKKTVYIDPD